jgi:hypothetical protein
MTAVGQDFYSYITDKGCSVMIKAPNVQTPLNWTGECKDGLAHGVGLLSYQFESDGKTLRWHVKGMRVSGKTEGLIWVLSDEKLRNTIPGLARSMVLSVEASGERVVQRKSIAPSDSVESALSQANAMLAEASRRNLLSVSTNVVEADIRQFLQTIKTADDPKVRGRSARGG